MRNFILVLISIFSFLVYASLPPTRLKGGNEAALSTTFNFDIGAMPVTRTGTSVVFGTLPVSGGGTGLTSLNAYNLLSGSGTAVNQIAPAASGTILFSTGTSSFPTFRSLVSLDVTTALGYTPIASSAASIAEVLGYVPLASSTAAIKSTLGYEPMASVSSTTPITITGGASNPVIGLATSGVVSGTYPKVTVDSFGRVTSGSVLNRADVVTGLGYTPVASVSATAPLSITGGASNPVVGHNDSGVASGTYTKVTTDSKGHVTSGTALIESDIPNLQTTKITSGVFTVPFGGTGVSTTSTGALLIGSGTTTYVTLPASATGTFLTMGSTSPVWTSVSPGGSVSAPTYQRFTVSGTYTTPVGVKKILVRICGAGGGGMFGGAGGTGAANPTSGGNTTFGGTLATANGGGAGGVVAGTNAGGIRGAAGTINSPGVILINIEGGDGQSTITGGATVVSPGGGGGTTFLGGGGNGGISNGDAGNDGSINSCSGGGGGGTSGGSGTIGGGGGASGSYSSFTVTTPAASYAVVIGVGGTGGLAGVAGNGGSDGGRGSDGFTLVEEYY